MILVRISKKATMDTNGEKKVILKVYISSRVGEDLDQETEKITMLVL